MDFEAAEARAGVLLKRAQRYRDLAAKAADHVTQSRLRRLGQDLEAEAAIEMAHAALLRHSGRDGANSREEAIAGAQSEEDT